MIFVFCTQLRLALIKLVIKLLNAIEFQTRRLICNHHFFPFQILVAVIVVASVVPSVLRLQFTSQTRQKYHFALTFSRIAYYLSFFLLLLFLSNPKQFA